MPGNYVTAKKKLGQHFLKDQNIARKIVAGLSSHACNHVLEIGPGMGILTRFLLEIPGIDLKVIELDAESADYMRVNFPGLKNPVIHNDFLKVDISGIFPSDFLVIGNFPYNISSQIFFRILDYRHRIPEVVCMVQKEVAERICHKPGSRTYGIMSVLLQTFYHVDYLFTVGPGVFIPPPKVQSAVIKLTRNERTNLGCDEALFFKVVKTAFNQRRKILGNALKSVSDNIPGEFSSKRAEQLSPEQFILLTCRLESEKK
jgi:16S rRNA (adenine1518-N6/adenine1519-N6)-dimethyltransferase